MTMDFPAALAADWDTDPTLAAAGLVPLHFEVRPPGSLPNYPYAVYSAIGNRTRLRNATAGYAEESHLRFNIYAQDSDSAAALGSVVEAFLDAIEAVPLAFDTGRQVVFSRTGSDVMRLPRAGMDGRAFVFLRSLTYRLEVARDKG